MSGLVSAYNVPTIGSANRRNVQRQCSLAWNTQARNHLIMAKKNKTFKAAEVDREQHLVIGRKVYERGGLSEAAANGLRVINFADQELATQSENIRVYQLGRDNLVRSLVEELGDTAIGELEAAGD